MGRNERRIEQLESRSGQGPVRVVRLWAERDSPIPDPDPKVLYIVRRPVDPAGAPA